MGESVSRTSWEMEKHTDKKAYQIRKQEERESRMALRDFQRHVTEEGIEMNGEGVGLVIDEGDGLGDKRFE